VEGSRKGGLSRVGGVFVGLGVVAVCLLLLALGFRCLRRRKAGGESVGDEDARGDGVGADADAAGSVGSGDSDNAFL
jgi:hypothetical protein